jgi:transposase-like protein
MGERWLVRVGLTGASSKQKAQLRRLAASLPAVLARSEPTPPATPRQRQRRLSTAQAVQVVQQYQAGDDMPVLAERWGISRKTVAEHLRRAGVTPRRCGPSPEQVQAAIELYAAGWSLARIGHRFGCDHGVVLRAMRRAGVPRRDSHGRPRP